MTMAFPTRKLTAVCEITTGQLHDVVLPPAYEGEAGAIQVSITLQSGGTAANVSDMKASMYLYDKCTDAMTDEVSMSFSGSTVIGTMPSAFFSISARMLLCILLTDTATGRTMTVGTLPLEVKNVRGGKLLSLRAPTPSEVVYVGRAPYIGANNHWMVWNNDTQSYEDSGVLCVGTGAQSVDGVQPDSNGNIQLNAQSGTVILPNGTYSVGAALPFTESPDKYMYMIGRVSYSGCSPCWGGGSGDNRTYSAVSIVRSGGNTQLYIATITGTYNTTNFTLTEAKRITIASDGSVSVDVISSVHIGAMYGIEM